MVERVRCLFPSAEETLLLQKALDAVPEGRKYQAAMQFVIECRGQSTLNQLIRDAVLQSRINPSANLSWEDLERDVNGWSLRPGVAALGKLISTYEHVFQRPILTVNFDPLLEIAIKRAGRGALTINLPNDGNFNGLIVNDNIAQVVHLHGFWSKGDTLHTPDRLTRERPLLAGNLRLLLQETVLVVLGYGGWKDVFTDALLKAISEQSQALDVLWAFYPKDPAEIIQRYSALLESFQSLPGRRVVAYAGVDCHELFPKLVSKLQPAGTATIIQIPVSKPSATLSLAMAATSNPPATEAWVGREIELEQLLKADSAVVALHGMGGFGKSSLAAKYVAEREKRRDIGAWYWADCREQGNTIQMHLMKVLEHLTRGEITAASLQKSSDQDILDLFFERLDGNRALVVFDNIDHYVEFETQRAIAMMNSLIERAITLKHDSQFVLTSRPILDYDSPRFMCLPVSGLAEPEVEHLFRLRGAQWDAARKPEQLAAVLRITQGSALTLNLIATQIAKLQTPLADLLLRIQQGSAPEVEDRILFEIWGMLKPEHQQVLRILAELPHPESEQRVATCLSDTMNFNRFGKAVRVLKGLNLIVVKTSANSGEVLELHPLVRSFIRKRYPAEEQKPIVEQVIGFFTRMMGRFRGRPEMGTIAVLGNWIAKIEICAENGRLSDALTTLHEIQSTLLSRGFVEEFLRLALLVIANYTPPDNPAEVKKFDATAEKFVDVLGDLGRYEEADAWIGRLAKTVVGKSARYIWLCDVRAYAFWIRGRFEDAKAAAAEGVQLKSLSHIDTEHDCGHTLALAQRDSGEVAPALSYFLAGETLEIVVALRPANLKRGGEFYGNIGRCLQLMGRFDDALICLRKSACLLESSEASNTLLNRGWAALWVGEILRTNGAFDKAYLAFRSAFAKWKVVSPGRASRAQIDSESLVEKLADNSLATCGDWECEEMYRNWLRI
jgi:tetratricopeptide (TPR) repeat protein